MKKILTCALFIGIITTGCVSGDAKKSESADKSYPKGWNYNSDWGKVSQKCIEGQHQSPINIVTKDTLTNSESSLKINYNEITVAALKNVKYAVNALITEEAAIDYNGSKYDLIQFHFHADSEHTIDGKGVPLELHLVHQNDNDQLTVLGVMFEEGEPNPAFQQLLDAAPSENNVKIEYNQRMDISKLLPVNRSFYSYDGSLTTPGCGSVVNWVVFKEPISVSKEQIDQFLSIRNGKKNNRPVQDLGDRVVEYNN